MNRRDFLFGTAAGLTYLGMLNNPALAGINNAATNKKIKLYSTKTKERISVTFWRDDWFDLDAFAEIEHLMRDWREDKTHPIDPYLIQTLHNINEATGNSDREIVITSAYRTYKTNEWLRNHPRYSAAKKSLHMHGRAVDFHIPGARLYKLRNAAQNLRKGGVGYYPKMHFVHIDTGPVRFWRV